jgi:hypothetical protein
MITSLIVTAVVFVSGSTAYDPPPPAILPAEPAVIVVPDRLDAFPFGQQPAPLHPSVAETYAQAKCVQWIDTALEAGWQPEELPRLMRIMFRESRCLPDACGETDSPHIRKCRDWGLMQINDYSWKRIIREMGISIEQMHDPYWNLWFARWLYEYSLERNDDGWVPWKFPPK